MEIISGTTDFQLNSGHAVTIGKFDGIHKGHRELIDRILKKKSCGLKSAVFTFDVSPLSFFAKDVVPGLTTNEEKRRIFEFLKIDTLIEYPLNEETAKIPPVKFVSDVLCKQMNMKYIAVGSDITFGYKGEGNAELLQIMSTNADTNGESRNANGLHNPYSGSSLGYEAEVVDKLIIDGEEVSSTLIRNVVASGNMEKAAKLIGVPYAVSGVVKKGQKIGRTIGFPTVNIDVKKDKLMPPKGVYFTEVSFNGAHFKGVTNIGTKPTVSSSDEVFVETHIIDFSEDIYGENITVKLLHFERPEQKFPDVYALRARIAEDVKNAGKYFL